MDFKIFVEPACSKQDILTTSVYVHVCIARGYVRQDLSRPQLVHLFVDFKIIQHSCGPGGAEVPFKTFV